MTKESPKFSLSSPLERCQVMCAFERGERAPRRAPAPRSAVRSLCSECIASTRPTVIVRLKAARALTLRTLQYRAWRVYVIVCRCMCAPSACLALGGALYRCLYATTSNTREKQSLLATSRSARVEAFARTQAGARILRTLRLREPPSRHRPHRVCCTCTGAAIAPGVATVT